MRRRINFLTLLILLAALLAACGDPTATIPTTNTAAITIVNTVGTTTTAPAGQTTTPATTASATTAATPAVTTTNGGTVVNKGKLVYTIRNGDKDEIYVINPDGSGKQKVAEGRTPLFSPDGTRVAFLAPTGKTRSQDQGGFPTVGIYSTKLDGSDRKLHCESDGNAQLDLIRWSPRNRYILMNGTQSGPGGLYLCSLTDGKLTPMFSDKSGAASLVFDWTPDGDNALWQALIKDTQFNIFYGDPDKNGKEGKQLTNGQNPSSSMEPFTFYYAARFSPDGKTVAVSGGKLFFLSVPGQKSPLEGKEVPEIQDAKRIAWSPDGKALAVSYFRQPGQLAIYDIASGKLTRLVDQAELGDWTRP